MTAPVAIRPTTDMVSQVEPILRATAAQSDARRDLAPEAMRALIDAGLMRLWVPRAYGGLEMDPVPALKIFEEIARIDSAAGWIVSNTDVISTFLQILPDEGSAEIYADPDAMVVGGWFPLGAAVPVDGGYRVTGQWAFGSGSTHATWLSGHALIMDEGAPRLGPDGNPLQMLVFFPADRAEIVDTWHSLGMRGTGSNDIRAQDVFVPERHTFVLRPWDNPGSAYSGPLYRFGLWMAAPPIATVALGIARAAIDDFIALATAKTPSYTQAVLADRPTVQDRIARARALADAGRAYLYAEVGAAWEHAQTGQRVGPEQGMAVALAGSFAVDAACQAVDLVHTMAGQSAIREEYRFQQYFRDVHTASQHAFASASRFESVGKLMLDRPSDWGFYYL